MTPTSFLWYSLIFVVDAIALLVLLATIQGLLLNWARVLIKFYFAEKESFLKKLGSASLPYDVHSKMLD